MSGDAVEALARAAAAVKESARAHKRAEFQHRKQARALMATLAEVERACRMHGIELHYGEGERSQGHGQGTS